MTNAIALGGIDSDVAQREFTGGNQEFLRARFWARLSTVSSLLTGRRNRLRSLAEQQEQIRGASESFIGIKTIELSKIAGSEGRSDDFDTRFMPKKRFLLHRWLNVNTAYHTGVQLPAIKVFELDGKYFVRDGNHRVSVAKFHRIGYIDAEVVRIAR